ncbi:SDR family oxidoreductase [uncultured Microbacterium sp.]|uniref:SDR family oxidoreductase n=1 Tax=uncultured Microbacterium sp. TaxID=191216 RepID=UPI0035C9B533
MKIAVIGGTGLIGSALVRHLEAIPATDVVVIARSTGVDVLDADQLAQALEGVSAVIDVINTGAVTRDDLVSFFSASTAALLHAEAAVGVQHHVLLSIIGVDQAPEEAHFAGKLAQENLVRSASVPYTIVRATQFFEYAEMAVGWGLDGETSHIPPLLMQPISLADTARMLADAAAGAPANGIIEIAGPERHDLVDVARRTLAASGQHLVLDPSWDESGTGTEMAGNLLLPHEGALIGTDTLQQWLDERSSTR